MYLAHLVGAQDSLRMEPEREKEYTGRANCRISHKYTVPPCTVLFYIASISTCIRDPTAIAKSLNKPFKELRNTLVNVLTQAPSPYLSIRGQSVPVLRVY